MDSSDNEQEMVEENIVEDTDSEIEEINIEEANSIKNGIHDDEPKLNNHSSDKLANNLKNTNSAINNNIKRDAHTITQEYAFKNLFCLISKLFF